MNDIDITQDLTSGTDDAAFADIPGNMQAPPGTQPAHGVDAVPENKQTPAAPAAPAEGDKPEPTLRDQLSSAFKGTDGQPTDQAAAPNAAAPAAAAPIALTQDGEGKWRQPDGTFASAEQITAFQAATAPPAEQSPAYAGLTPAEQQQFQSLPAELRTLYERRMEDLNARAARYSEYDQIEQVVGPRREMLAAHGNNPVAAIHGLFALSDFAARDPGQYLLWFASQHNLDVDALLDERDQQNQNVDPTVRQLQGQVQQLTGILTQQQQAEQQRVQQANLDTVVQFAEAKDASGALVRPYVTDVLNDWHSQITAVRAANPTMPNTEILQKAYENAVWANPAVRAKMQQAEAAKQRQQDQQQVTNARAAGASVSGGPASTPSQSSNNSNLSLRDDLVQQFEAARAV